MYDKINLFHDYYIDIIITVDEGHYRYSEKELIIPNLYDDETYHAVDISSSCLIMKFIV